MSLEKHLRCCQPYVSCGYNNITISYIITKTSNLRSNLLTARSFRVTLLISSTFSVCLSLLIKPLVVTLYGLDYLPVISPFLLCSQELF